MDRPFFNRMRGAWEVMSRGYDGAADSRFRTQRAFNRSFVADEDSHIGPYDRSRLRLEGRDMFRNHAVVHGVIERLADYAVFDGIWPQAVTSNQEWNKEAENWWQHVYVPTCDFRSQAGVDFITFQSFNISERMTVGENGYILLKNGQLQPIEADRIDTPTKFSTDKQVVQGIRQTKKGKVIGYYVLPRKSGGSIDRTQFKYVRRENFKHCWKPSRPDMVHGIPDLAPVINKLRDYDTTDENVLNKIKADAMQLWIRKTAAGGALNTRLKDQYKLADSNDKNQQRVEKMEGLSVHNMLINEDLTPFEGKTPNSQYVPYMEHELRIISQCLRLPYEFMLMIFTAGSYSAQRAAMIHAHHTVLKWVNWNNKVFNRPIWNWRIAKAMKNGEISLAPVDKKTGISEWWKVDWSLPPWHEIDSDKQAKGDLAQYKMGKTSMKAIVRSTGRDRDDVFREKAEDQAAASRIAAEVSEATGQPVDPNKIIETSTTKSATLEVEKKVDDEED